jgi:putative thioredoxin
MNHEVQDFQKQVLERSKQVPVLADFWAPWCGPCRTLGPILERMATQAGGRWELVKINTDEHQDLAADYKIASIPAVKLFVNGKVADEFVGALPEREIRRFLDKALPSPAAKQVAEAQRLLNEGANADAAKLLEPVVAGEPGNIEARVLLAQALLGTDPERVATVLEPVAPGTDYFDRADAIRTLARLVQVMGHPDRLPEANVRDRYLAGAAAIKSGDYGSALEAFIEVLERNRQYENEGAKDACKAIFQLLGMRNPLVEHYFRAFSSALHA